MPSPDPTYDAGLVLVDQPLNHSAVSHTAHLTFALTDTASQTAQAIADAYQAAFNDNLKSIFDNNVTLQRATVLRGDGTTTPTVAVATPSPEFGTRSMTSPPPEVAVLVKKITSFAGRANRGRTYFPWIAAQGDITEAGKLDGTVQGTIGTAIDAFTADLDAANIPMVICNRVISTNPTPPPATYVSAYHTGPVVTLYTVEDFVATQRRRLVRS